MTPCWPQLESGITIGIGYDLRFATADQLQQDWAAHLPADACTKLRTVCGIKVSATLKESVKTIEVPLAAAMAV